MNMTPSQLTVRRGKSPKNVYVLSDQTVIIGREAINDIMFQELEISRRHASISFANGKYTIEDLNSTNGTFVNGRRITTPVLLNSGDVLDLGDTVSLIFHSGAAAVEKTKVDSQPAQVVDPTVQRQQPLTEPSYAPPPEVPQYSERADVTPPPTARQAPPQQPSYPPPGAAQQMPAPEPEKERSRRNLYIGCGCLLLLAVVGCIATFAFLDSYQGGDFLYCQTFRPVWEVIFGVSDMAAACS